MLTTKRITTPALWKYSHSRVSQFVLTSLLFLFFIGFSLKAYAQPCDPSTPSFTIDLTGAPDSVWHSPPVTRDGYCCTAAGSDRCVEFNITLDPNSAGIQINLISGAIPSGSLFYEISCANPTQIGDTLCLDGVGPHRITFCKPGNNDNIYEIVSLQEPTISPPITVSDGCQGLIYTQGYDETTIEWAPIPFDSTYLGYMSCTSGCDSVDIVVTGPGYPPFIDFEVSGYRENTLCDTARLRDTVRVFFVSDKAVDILPQNPVVCFGGVNTTITANATGGAPPYSYVWSTGETTQSIDVGVGTYWVEVYDTTNCPTVLDTVTVTAHLSPISVNAGADAASCTNSPTATLSGTVNVADGGIWSGGNGTYTPNDSSLTVNYTPTPAEIISGSVTLTLTTTGNDGCPAESDNVSITIEPAPTIDAGPNQVVCGDVGSISLNGSFTNAGGVVWSGGSGTFGNANNPVTTYTPVAADTAAGVITLTLTTTATGACDPVSDIVQITFTPIPTVNAGNDQTVCADVSSVSLAGSITTATGGTWTTSGTGSFSPNANTLTASYIPSSLDTASGNITLTLTSTGNGSCNAYSDQMVINFYSAPTVDVGSDITECSDVGSITLNPSTQNATSFSWSTSGSGIYSPDALTEFVDYSPSNADTANGNVTLTLTVTSTGCGSYSDNLVLTLNDAPTVSAGSDITTCKDIASVGLNGVITNATGGIWTTSGSGTFSPSATNLSANYIPSAADTAAGAVTLTLTTTGNGLCNAYNDQITITFTDIPTVNAGADETICADASGVTLSGVVTVATGGVWSSNGTGTFSPAATNLGATYVPSASDISTGNVTLTLTTTGNGLCQAYNDQMSITINPSPTVSAGTDQTVCGDAGSVSLNGSVTNAGGGIWTTSGTGSFSPNNTTLNANYIPTSADTAAGGVTLTLTTTGNGLCNVYNDQMSITFTNAPTVSAGSDITTCKDIASVGLSGVVTNATGGVWTTSGSGSFSPSASNLSANYIPSSADTAAGSVTLTLTTTGNGLCNAYNDQITITFTDIPTVNAGADETICADASGVTLSGVVTVATGGVWSSNGTGTFSPAATNLGATYVPSASDISTGNVTLTLTTTGNGLCQAYNDQMSITINPAPTVSAGSDQTVCGDAGSVSLNGSVTNAGGGIWTTSGTGSFSPNNTTLNANYIPTSADTAAGGVTLTLTTTGNGLCNAYNDQMSITFTNAPTVNAGSDITTCKDIASVGLSGAITNATGGVWTTSGSGTFSPSATNLSANYIPSAADTAAGAVTLTLTTTGNGLCNAYNDQITITFTDIPTVNAGADETICADASGVTLSGAVTVATGGIWSSNGTGTFSPAATNLGATYVPSAADTAVGFVTLTLTTTGNGLCQAYNDQMNITINPAPVVYAGADQTICADAGTVSLNGTVYNAGGGNWTSSGTGTFSPNNSTLNANYIPSASDTAAGSVTLTLTTTGNGLCNAYNDQMVITINPAPVVDAGVDQTICADAGSVTLNGLIFNATSGVWTTSGTGTFSPNSSTLNANYIPSAADTAAGSVTLTLTTKGNGLCNAYNDQMIITINPAPVVNADVDQTICADAGSVSLNGVVYNASGGNWTTTGSGTFSPNSTTLNANYIPSAADTAAGSVTLTLTTTGNGLCSAYSDQMVITINPAPVVNADIDQTICADAAMVSLNGTVYNAGGGKWTTSGSGIFSPSSSTLNANYIPSLADTAAGAVTLTLTTTGNGLCNAYNDQMIITINPAPVVNAGANQTVCADVTSVSLNGSVYNASGGAWSTSGTGSFSPNSTTLNASYIPSAADTAAGSVTLTLTTTGNGLCNAYNDQMTITLNPAPIVSAGADQTVCADISAVSLNGSVSNVGGGEWTTSGSGSFTPNSTTLNANYIPSAADTAAGAVTLTLTTTGNGLCSPYNDQMTITLTDAPTVSAGNDITTCKDIASIALNGSVTTATGGIWSTSGSGTFNPNNTTLSANYIPSAADTTAGGVTLTLTTTGNGLCNTYSDNIVITLTDIPTANAGADQTVCADINGVSLSGGVQIATGGVWSTNGTGAFSPNSTTLNATYVPSAIDTATGSVTLTLTTTGNGACQAYFDQSIISINPAPQAFAGNDTSVCITNPNVPLGGWVMHASGGVWSTSGSGVFSPNNTVMNPTYITSAGDQAGGNIEIYLTTTGNGLCNPVVDTMVLSITPLNITVFAGNDSLVCGDDSLVLNGQYGGAQGAIWTSLGDGNFGNDSTNTSANYYFGPADTVANYVDLVLTTTGNGGCVAQDDTIHVDIQDPLVLALGAADSTCRNGVEFSVTSGTSTSDGYWWTYGDGMFLDSNALSTDYISGPIDTTQSSITLYFTTQNNGVCAALTDSLLITYVDAPSVGYTFNLACLNDATMFMDTSSAIGGISNWNWTIDDTISASTQNTSLIFNDFGVHDVQLMVESGYGCKDSITQQVTVHPLPEANFSENAQCYVDSVTIMDASTIATGSNVNWDWDVFNVDTGSGQYITVAFDSAGTYSFELIVTSDFGCLDTVVGSLDVRPNPVAAFTTDSVCLNDTTFLMDQSTVEFGFVETWQWDFGNNTDTLQNPANVFDTDGTHDVTLIVTSNIGCSDTLVQSIVINPLPNATFSYQGFCEEDDVLFFDETTINLGTIESWQWDLNGTNSLDQNPSYGFGVQGNYDVTLIAGSNLGCYDTITQAITISPNPTAEFSMSDNVTQILDDVDFYDESIDASQWYWDFGDTLGYATDQNPTYAFNNFGQYEIELVIENQYGCTDSVSHVITVKQPPLAPSGFSPNADGLNDNFNILGGYFIEFRLDIYNNWGKLIFTTSDPTEGWDGTYEGVDQPMGVYVYLYEVMTEDGVEYSGHGDVTLIR